MWQRITVGIILLMAVFFAPFWCTVLLSLWGLFHFRRFYEALGAALLLDLLYGLPIVRFWHVPFFLTLVTLVVFIAIEFTKTKMTLYADD